MKTTARQKYFLTVTNAPVTQAAIQYPPSLFKYPKGTFYVLPHTLKIRRKITRFRVARLVHGERTNELGPP
jgi:hypothetical protein